MTAETAGAETPEGHEPELQAEDNKNSAATLKNSSSDTLGDLKNEAVDPPSKNIDFLLDVPLQVSVELGRTKMLVNQLLKLNQGSVIELAQMVEEPMDILINGKLVARGEVVVSNDRFGVRITDIMSQSERIESLK
jgi:flagellar motor switch protein FliN/FliY